jgi:hypothetical protein
VKSQTLLPDEILIADDGSKPETKHAIDEIRAKFKLPIRHIWQEDKGFRKTMILNETLRVGTCEYIIQTDGDILLHRHFIQDHIESAKRGYFIRGSRSLISENRTKQLLEEKIFQLKWTDLGLSNKFNSIYNPFLSHIFSLFNNPTSIVGVKGCNFSFWKEDFIRVNGFNNDFNGWGREDSEIAVRLINSGIKKRHLKFRAVCFHLHHGYFSREYDKINTAMLKEAVAKKITWAVNGYTTFSPVVQY